jgi:hypothetical protein
MRGRNRDFPGVLAAKKDPLKNPLASHQNPSYGLTPLRQVRLQLDGSENPPALAAQAATQLLDPLNLDFL